MAIKLNRLKTEEPTSPEKTIRENHLSALSEPGWLWVFCVVCLVVIFTNLGGAALFEPDEGRNAEKAREILLLGDWVTPYENFLTTLDKPIFFYWLIALCFKIFGISEWSARLPSALAALGCILLVYRLARRHWGSREALWGCLILVTSIEFFMFSRIVIFDMTLTFFVTLALSSFYAAALAGDRKYQRLNFILMYAAMGAGTLVKGLIALIVPGTVIVFYLLLTRKWFLFKTMNLPLGAVIYCSIVMPSYLWVESRNPGYLKYFFWDEHFVRFTTPRFDRSKNWYYFFMVLGVGFLPWSFLLPIAVKDLGKRLFRDGNLFLVLWVTLPFLFFSASDAKLPHYILPIFPALAILMGQAVATRMNGETNNRRWILYVPWLITLGFVVYILIGAVWPRLLPSEIRSAVTQQAVAIAIYGAMMSGIYGSYFIGVMRGIWRDAGAAYLCTCVGIALFLLLSGQIVKAAAFHRAAKPLAEETAPLIDRSDQIVFYGTYLEGVPFYLGIDRPIWLVEARHRAEEIGNSYVAERRKVPAPGYGQVVFDADEFAERWKRNEKVFRVFLKEKSLLRFSSEVGASPRILAKVDEYLLVTNR
jgi:4-amino-4-deoxy-L-arabinose transferase-like glycosyltransferase